LDKFDEDGQCLQVDDSNNINILYNYNEDKRIDKSTRVSKFYHNEKNHIIGTWKVETLKKTIEDKFNKNGFFICKKNKYGVYNTIHFGNPINFNYWIECFKKKNIYYDGYSKLKGRWRGVFRAKIQWWNGELY
jgi:hypothetical protein